MAPAYGRELLLFGPKRNEVLELWEVLRFGTDTFGDANYLSLYGLKPDEWYARGVRVLGRTAIECTPDRVANEIGREIAETVSRTAGHRRAMVVDPFVGSGNTLYWILHHLPGANGTGFELDPLVYGLTKQNLAMLGLDTEVLHTDYVHALRELNVADDALIVAFIAPPWGDGFSQSKGLDLRATTPPVRETVDAFAEVFRNAILFAIQVTERVVPESVSELTTRADWSVLHIFDSTKAGQNHNGLLLMSRGWRPG